MCDVSSTGKLVVYADDMDAALNAALGLDAAPGVRRTAWADGALIARMARDEVWALSPAGGAAHLHSRLAEDTHVVEVTSGLAGVAIVGPDAFSVLAALTELDVSSIGFPDMTCAQASVAEIPAALVRRDSDVPRFDLYFGREYGEHMWTALLDAGAAPMGSEALELARQRKGRGPLRGAYVTTLFGWPSRKAMTLVTAPSFSSSTPSGVWSAMCGVSTT